MAAFLARAVVAGVRWLNRFAPDFAPLPLRSAGWRLWEKLVRGHRRGQVGRMIFSENELQQHYRLLLGVASPWQVKHVKLELDEKRMEIELAWTEGAKAKCPVCGQDCTLYDYAPERTWRHLDTMQFETILRARVPRADCTTDGVKTVAVPWAEPGGRFTRLFERFAIDVLLSARSVKAAAGLLGLSWDEVDHILRRAVARGLSRRELEALTHLGIDEKSFRSGPSYIALLTDLKRRRVLDVVEGRTQAAAEALWDTLSAEQGAEIEAVAVDMGEAFLNASRAKAPQAELVQDTFHGAAHLNDAVDQVRRAEHEELMAAGDETLKGWRQWWLYNPMHFSQEQAARFAALKDSGLNVARAWAAKELFTKLWTDRYEGAARRFFKQSFGWVSRSRLKPLIPDFAFGRTGWVFTR